MEDFALKKRFAGNFGEDYTLFSKAYPHFHELQEKVAKEILKTSQGKQNYEVLEIGCGPGPTTLEILKLCPNVTLTAVDSESQLIEQAKQNLNEYLSRIEFFTMDALSFLKNIADS